MIKGIIFDLGSTLIQFKSNWPDVVRAGAEATATWFFKQRRIKVDQESLVEAILEQRRIAFAQAAETLQEAQMRQILLAALQQTNVSKRAETMLDMALRQFFGPEEAAHDPFPDAAATLKTLRAAGLKVGILSNAPDDRLVQRLVNINGLRPWASPVFSSAGLGWRKPSPQPFALIAKRWQLPPEQIAVVGDSLVADILGAQSAGMAGILAEMAPNPANAQATHIRPDRRITALAQVPPLIQAWPLPSDC